VFFWGGGGGGGGGWGGCGVVECFDRELFGGCLEGRVRCCGVCGGVVPNVSETAPSPRTARSTEIRRRHPRRRPLTNYT